MSKLLQELDVDPVNLLALGDGENDVEMLQVRLITTLGEGRVASPILKHLQRFYRTAPFFGGESSVRGPCLER